MLLSLKAKFNICALKCVKTTKPLSLVLYRVCFGGLCTRLIQNVDKSMIISSVTKRNVNETLTHYLIH